MEKALLVRRGSWKNAVCTYTHTHTHTHTQPRHAAASSPFFKFFLLLNLRPRRCGKSEDCGHQQCRDARSRGAGLSLVVADGERWDRRRGGDRQRHPAGLRVDAATAGTVCRLVAALPLANRCPPPPCPLTHPFLSWLLPSHCLWLACVAHPIVIHPKFPFGNFFFPFVARRFR